METNPAEQITLTIDGQAVTVPVGTTLLDAAKTAGVDIPTICYHEATTSNALCRMCVVEVEGARVLIPACAVQAGGGMIVHTDTPRIQRARRTILEMLTSTVDLSEYPQALEYMEIYQANPERFPGAKRRTPPVIDDNPMYVRDYAKCVLCWRCVQVCAEDAQYINALNFSGRGFDTQVATFFGRDMPATTCVFCGQCVGVCPSGALKPRREYLLEQGLSPAEIVASTPALPKKNGRRSIQS